MKKYIAVFEAAHVGVERTQYSCITWEQEAENIDTNYVSDLIKNTTAKHFFNTIAGNQVDISVDNITIGIKKVELFK